MASAESIDELWNYFEAIPKKHGWYLEQSMDNAAEGLRAYTIFDGVTLDNGSNALLGRTAISGPVPDAVAEAKFEQTIGNGTELHGAKVEITNRGDGYPSLRRMTFTVQVMKPYPPVGKLPEEGTQVVIFFDNKAYLRIAKVLQEGEDADIVVDDLNNSLEGDKEEIEDTPQVWDALRRMGLDDQNYRMRRLNIAETLRELVMGASPAFDDDNKRLNPPDDILESFVFDTVDEMQRYIDIHVTQGSMQQADLN